ncbi:hypothetical protein RND81_03G198100 [Saponaria officinalis]|uniref:Uncharacterized protein n=1 Tax=Saponaria officinalis TaxID=3572 RepID=A0AAW1M5N9_SAPOF
MSSSSSSTTTGSVGGPGFDTPDHQQLSPSDQLCYVHCTHCDTVLAVSVPSSSMFMTVTVRCGHCGDLLSANMLKALLLPSPPPTPPSPQFHHHLPPSSFFSSPHNLFEEIRNTTPNIMMNNNNNNQAMMNNNEQGMMAMRGVEHHHLHQYHHDIPKPQPVNRPPEKRQRVPSAYNRFIKDEIQRIKAGNPDISHREAFSAAAKNWAHFPHIHFGLMPDHQPVKKANVRQQQESEHEILMKEGFLTPQANVNHVGIGPY